jgi:alpha-beta hydrolase superfamily lysophospholipase
MSARGSSTEATTGDTSPVGAAIVSTIPSSSPPSGTARVANASESYFERERGLRLYHCEFVPERLGGEEASGACAAVVLMHGYGEHCRRYDELASFLVRRGHTLSCFDARGHGRSQGPRGHVRAYADYVDDFVAFLERVRARHGDRPLVVLGHSNGGLIALRAAQRGLPDVHGLVLTGPLLGLRAGRKPVPDGVARALSWALPWLPLPNGIHAEDLTHDAALREAHAADRWVHGVATPRWYWSALVAAREALAEAPRLTLPLLVVLGERDPIVDPACAAELVARAGTSDKQLVVRPGELHEVLNETRRVELFAQIASWIERIAAHRAQLASSGKP